MTLFINSVYAFLKKYKNVLHCTDLLRKDGPKYSLVCDYLLNHV